MVMATQNPIEQEGTYPLPEAQLDRFMFNIFVDYPSESELMEIIKEEIMGAMSEEEVAEEATEEQPLEEMDVASMLPELTPQKINELITVLEVFKKLVTNGVIPMAALGAGAGALYNKVAGPQVPPEDMGDK